MRRMAIGLLVACLMVGANADAQPVPSQGTVIITLGTAGGPRPRPHRSQAANMLIVNGTPYLIDVGENAVRRIVQSGVNFLQVGRVFITHAHSDHTLGLPALLASQWELNRRGKVEIYGPPGTQKLIAGLLDFLTPNSTIRGAEGFPSPFTDMVVAHDVPQGLVYQDANVTVTAVENTHFQFPVGSAPYGIYKSYSYRFATPTRVVVFTGDTGPSPAVTELARGADVLVSEIDSVDELLAAYKRNGAWQAKTPEEQEGWLRHQNTEHLSPTAVGELAEAAGVKMVILTHLVPTADPNDGYERWANEVRRTYHGEVRVAKDLARF